MGNEGISVCSLKGMETAFPWGCSWGGRGQAVCFPGVSLPEGIGGGLSPYRMALFSIDIPGMGGALFSFGFAYQTTRVACLFTGRESGGLMPWLGYGLLRTRAMRILVPED